MPAVSVIIPTYKHRDFVLATLDSVFAQTFTDYEVIVINDGSPDDTAALLRPLAEAGRIRYIEQENTGQSLARNRGIAAACGEFIALLDDDDLWPPDKLAWQVDVLRNDPDTVLVYGHTSFVDAEFDLAAQLDTTNFQEPPEFPGMNAPGGRVYETFLEKNYIHTPGQTLVRASLLKKLGGLDVSIWGADDYDLYIRLAAEGDFCYRHHFSLYHRKHSGNASKNVLKMSRNVRAVGVKHLGRVPRWQDRRLWLVTYAHWRKEYLYQLLDAANISIAQGSKAQAREIWSEAFWMLPLRSYQMLSMASLFVRMW